jgi:hypothetical protein
MFQEQRLVPANLLASLCFLYQMGSDGYSQQSERQVTMDLRLQLNFNVQIEFEP